MHTYKHFLGEAKAFLLANKDYIHTNNQAISNHHDLAKKLIRDRNPELLKNSDISCFFIDKFLERCKALEYKHKHPALFVPRYFFKDKPPSNNLKMEFYKNGNKKSACYYHKGKPHGYSITWQENGNYEQCGTFVNGVVDGEWWYWSGRSSMYEVSCYVEGECVKEFTRYHDLY